MSVAMPDVCVKNSNITSVTVARRNAEVAESRLSRMSCNWQMMQLVRTADPAMPSGLLHMCKEPWNA